ncbi:MAG: hypothetical protein IPH43_13465 [Xanthomonadales bacterium]|nr:hypothetical protein [Xanthomonadales bacterium]
MSPISCGEDAQGNIFVGTQGGNAYILQSASASDLIFKNGFETEPLGGGPVAIRAPETDG